MTFRNEGFLRSLTGLGLVWMMLGMVVMPSGVSFNPGRLYQISLVLLLYLPALWLAGAQRGALWRALMPLPAFRILLLLLAWAGLSLWWAPPHRPADEVGRLLSVLAFVLGWQVWEAGDAQRGDRLLLLAGICLAFFSLVFCVKYLITPPDDGRMVGEGVIATANYAAAVMGAACVWLSRLPTRKRIESVLRGIAIAVLLVFVALTQTRSVWLALAVCVIAAPLWDRRRSTRWQAATMLLITLLACVLSSSLLLDRGASLRPELFMQSLHLIAQHPWLGLGQGAEFTLVVANEGYTHSHNVLTQTMIALGLPGLVLTMLLWLLVAWLGWRHRQQVQGRLLLSMWVYASVVLQFDMPQLLAGPRPAWLLFWLPFSLALGMAWRDRVSSAAVPPRTSQQAG